MIYSSNSSIQKTWRSLPSSSPIGFPSSPNPSVTAAPPLSEAASTPFAQVSPFLSRFLICSSLSLWKNARLLSSLGWCSSLGFTAEADADASGSTSTQDQASYASASFAAPFPDAQQTG
ncbi:hypothetical protein ZIOFF_006343 [Zingiber officinale]|uniref:Uncharacterized protein n=1 Tax=Zingiber officinale TaxID=94328 RepID=A0A8J5LVK3_ZINOF|nr:hypothetical protein ZIOFF_006343 [Zingiber officinale]